MQMEAPETKHAAVPSLQGGKKGIVAYSWWNVDLAEFQIVASKGTEEG